MLRCQNRSVSEIRFPCCSNMETNPDRDFLHSNSGDSFLPIPWYFITFCYAYYIYTHRHRHRHTHMHAHTRLHSCTHAQTHRHTHRHTDTQTHRHTHKHSLAQARTHTNRNSTDGLRCSVALRTKHNDESIPLIHQPSRTRKVI